MNQLQTIETESGQRALFDYSKLDQETQVLVRLRAGEIQSLAKRMAADVVEIGGKLAEVKDRIGGNGKFNDWLNAELGWSERTAYNFIAVWQKFGAANFALEKVATSALYLLAAPSTPAEAVEVAKQIVDSGEQVTHGLAKEIVRQAKAKRPKQVALVEESEESNRTPVERLRADENELIEESEEDVPLLQFCLCGDSDIDHKAKTGNCEYCDCEIFQKATAEEIAERQATEKALGVSPTISKPASASESPTAPKSSAKPVAVKVDASARPPAWFKQRIEIVITLMPGADAASRKVMHSVRAGDGMPFVELTTGEYDVVDTLPIATYKLYVKAADAFAKKPAKPAAKPAPKPTTKPKPAAKKPATKTKTKKGEKK